MSELYLQNPTPAYSPGYLSKLIAMEMWSGDTVYLISWLIIQRSIFMKLSQEETARFARLIFTDEDQQFKELDLMTLEQLQKIRSVYAQKIAYETVNGKTDILKEATDQNAGYRLSRIPSFLTSFCCCCYPEHNQDYFEIDTVIFLKRVTNPLLFWNNSFLEINNGKSEHFGTLWLTITLVIFLGLASNMNKFFLEPANFEIELELFLTSLGIIIFFKLVEPFIYSSVLGCLGGSIISNQSSMLVAYSLVLQFLPTIFCLVPSLYWHVLMIGGACVLRTIFLFRNYSIRLETKSYILFMVIAIIEFMYAFITLRTLFATDAGYTFSDGFLKVFGENPAGEVQQEGSVQSKKAEHLEMAYFQIRQFEY